MLKNIFAAASFSKLALVSNSSLLFSRTSRRSFADASGADGGAGKQIFIGNLPWEITENEISEFFSKYGSVTSIKMMKDNQTGRPRGFGFITLNGQMDKAIAELDGTELRGRAVRVNEAKPPAPRDPNAPRYNNRDREFRGGDRGGDRGDFQSRGGDRGDRGDRGERGGYRGRQQREPRDDSDQ